MSRPAFQPDYRHVEMAARNIRPARLPLYEHAICDQVMETLSGRQFAALAQGDAADRLEYFRCVCDFFKSMGYDTVSYECCIGPIMPGSGSLGGHVDPVIKTMQDFERYPWDEIPQRYFDAFAPNFTALRQALPAGMKAVGGVGNGIFECVQDICGYMGLCYIAADDPELYAALFEKVGQLSLQIWTRFLKEFGDVYCVCRFGDDLGFKSNTLLSAEDIKTFILPHYKRIVDAVHAAGKPFLLHSCGCIFNVMDALIDTVGIDAKHSNEDQIAPFSLWVERYGDRLGNFGGIDTDAVCRLDAPAMTEYILDVLRRCDGHGGFAFGSGNSIPYYVPADKYLHMVQTVRQYRGDTRF